MIIHLEWDLVLRELQAFEVSDEVCVVQEDSGRNKGAIINVSFRLEPVDFTVWAFIYVIINYLLLHKYRIICRMAYLTPLFIYYKSMKVYDNDVHLQFY